MCGNKNVMSFIKVINKNQLKFRRQKVNKSSKYLMNVFVCICCLAAGAGAANHYKFMNFMEINKGITL